MRLQPALTSSNTASGKVALFLSLKLKTFNKKHKVLSNKEVAYNISNQYIDICMLSIYYIDNLYMKGGRYGKNADFRKYDNADFKTFIRERYVWI